MPQIKATEYSKIVSAHSSASSRLDEAAKIEHLPKALKDEVKALIKKFKDYDLAQHREKGKMLTGKMLTAEELKQIVIDASGYTKWIIDTQFDEEEPSNYQYLLDRYGVDVADKSKIVEYRISRKVNSRDDLWLVSFTVFPGHVEISYDTNRVGYGEDNLIANKDIKKVIEAQFD